MRLPDFHGVVQRPGHACARNLGGIEGAAFDQALDHPPIDRRHIDAPAKIEERLEGTVVATALENHFNGFFADIFHRRHAETNLVAHRREIGQTFVDVRRQDLDVLVAALGEILNHFVGIAHFRGQKRRHELHRIMGFEIGGLVGNQSVGRGVRFVKAVAREGFHLIEDFGRFLLVDLF